MNWQRKVIYYTKSNSLKPFWQAKGLRLVREVQKYLKFSQIQLEINSNISSFSQRLNCFFIPEMLQEKCTPIFEKNVYSISKIWTLEQLRYSKCLKRRQFRDDTHTDLATRNIPLLFLSGCDTFDCYTNVQLRQFKFTH